MGSGRHLDLEVKLSKPASQPRSLALMTHTFKALPAGRYGITRRYPMGRTKALFMQMFAYLLLFPRYPPLLLLLRFPCVRAVVSHYRNGPPGWAPVLLRLLLAVDVCLCRLKCLRACGVSVCVASPWAGTACLPLAMRLLALGRGKAPSSVCFWRCYSCQSNVRVGRLFLAVALQGGSRRFLSDRACWRAICSSSPALPFCLLFL